MLMSAAFSSSAKKQVNPEYDDSYYRACFLCREITVDSFIEADYNPDDGKNQLTEEEAVAIQAIATLSKEMEASDINNELNEGVFVSIVDKACRKIAVLMSRCQLKRTNTSVA